MKPTKEQQLQRAKDYAKSRKGGQCLSSEYITVKAKLHWKCHNPDHPSWYASGEIISRGSWCTLCIKEEQAKKYALNDGLQKAQARAAEEGGKCLSTEYKKAKAKLKWECNQGHTWESTFEHVVTRKQWCKECDKDRGVIHDAYEQALMYVKSNNKDGNFKFSKSDKIKSHTLIEWKCKNDKHKPWFAEFRNVVKNGGWCRYCAGKFTAEEYLEMAKEYAISQGGTCLSDKYENQNTKLEFKCHNPKHKSWFSCYDHLVPNKRWCKDCEHENDKPLRDKYLNKAKEHALSKGGECLSTEYTRSNDKLLWQCVDKSHQPWEATYGNVVGTLDRWCPRCVGQFSAEEWLEKAKIHAESKGGEFLSKKFTTVNDHYLWKCIDPSHKSWATSMSNVFNNNTWCPECGNSTYYKENNTRVILEYLLGFNLNKARPSWIINPETDHSLELDGYNEEHKFAFEFQGRHHFEDNVYDGSNLEDIIKKDKIKKKSCEDNGVYLFVINDVKQVSSIDDWIAYVVDELEKNNINFNKYFDYDELVKKIIEANKTSYKDAFLEKAKVYAESKGGECLSEYYINYNTPLKWKCRNDEHPFWETGIWIIDRNAWCPRCVGKFSKEEFLEKAKLYAKSKKGHCLSAEYINSNTPLEWKCHDDMHPIFFRTTEIISKNRWCPECKDKDYFKNYKQ
jgi:hypothetical protein